MAIKRMPRFEKTPFWKIWGVEFHSVYHWSFLTPLFALAHRQYDEMRDEFRSYWIFALLTRHWTVVRGEPMWRFYREFPA